MTAPGGDTSDTAPVILDRLGPAAEDGWHVLFDLAETDNEHWVLIGGQMVYLLAIENGPEGLNDKMLWTERPAHTVQAPGTVQAGDRVLRPALGRVGRAQGRSGRP